MSTAPAMPWSSAQQAWLQAMGYTVLHGTALAEALAADIPVVLAAPAAISSAPPADIQLSVAAARPSQAASSASAERSRPTARPAPSPAAPPTPPAERMQGIAGTRRPTVRLPDRLQIALLRASGLNPNDPATQTLMETWPLDVLRGNGPAKRALWPQLRALRRRASTP